jgi:Ca2+-binding EF-hand superfamily protein
MSNLKELFDFFDRNSDGVISRSELIELVDVLLDQHGIGKSTKVMKEFDVDQNGVIDFEEFELLYDNYFGL